MRYEWHDKKAASNFRKHGVSFAEATSVFQDPLASTYQDPDHSEVEQRLVTMGLSRAGRVLLVAHAEINENCLRIISARQANRRERKDYEEHT